MKRTLLLLAAIVLTATTTACHNDFGTPSFAQLEVHEAE
jgi:hypothetical protein